VSDPADPVMRAGTVLGRGVVPVLAVGVEAVLVVVELGVLHDQPPAGVRSGVTEHVELRPGVAHDLVALPPAGADVITGVVEVAGVRAVPAAAVPVARKDSVRRRGVLVLEVRARSGEVRAVVAVAADLPAVVATVPPDLVAGTAAGTLQEVAGREIVDPDVVGFPDHDAVQAGALLVIFRPEVLVGLLLAAGRAAAGAVDDDLVAVHAPHRDPRGVDVDTGRRAGPALRRPPVRGLVVTRSDEDEVTGTGGVDGPLDRAVLPTDAVPGPDPQHPVM
jgi:hypothetical protein